MAFSTEAANITSVSSRVDLQTKQRAIDGINLLHSKILEEKSRNKALQQENAKFKDDLVIQAIANQTALQRIKTLEDDVIRAKEREATALRALQGSGTKKGASKSGPREFPKALRRLKKSVREKIKEFEQCLGEGKYDAEYLLRYRWHDCHFERLKKLNGVQTKELDVLLSKCRERLLSTTHTLGQDINTMLENFRKEQEASHDPTQTEILKNHAGLSKTSFFGGETTAARVAEVGGGESGQHPAAEKAGSQPTKTFFKLVADDTFKEIEAVGNGVTKKETMEEIKAILKGGRSDETQLTETEHERAEAMAPSLEPAMNVRKSKRYAIELEKDVDFACRPYKRQYR